MDPQAALFDLLDAIERNDRAAVDEQLEALKSWNDGGGFMPFVLRSAKNSSIYKVPSSQLRAMMKGVI